MSMEHLMTIFKSLLCSLEDEDEDTDGDSRSGAAVTFPSEALGGSTFAFFLFSLKVSLCARIKPDPVQAEGLAVEREAENCAEAGVVALVVAIQAVQQREHHGDEDARRIKVGPSASLFLRSAWRATNRRCLPSSTWRPMSSKAAGRATCLLRRPFPTRSRA